MARRYARLGLVLCVVAAASVLAPPPVQAASIGLRGAAFAGNAVAPALSVAKPVGVAEGDVLVASVDVRGKPAITAPAGWTQVLRHATGTAMTKATYYRVAGPGEPASYAWSFPRALSASGGIVAYSGVDSASPIAAAAGQANGLSNLITAPSVTTTTADAQLLGFFGAARATAITPPAGMTERGEAKTTSGTSRTTSEGADAVQADAGASGPRSASMPAAATARSVGHLLALRPAAAPPPPNTAPATEYVTGSSGLETPAAITLQATDVETCELQFAIVAQPGSGTVGGLQDGPCTTGSPFRDSAQVTYTPNAGFTGTDTFTFRANDGPLSSNLASVTVTVGEVPADPVIGAAGDIACDPTKPGFNNGNGTPIACQQKATSDLVADPAITEVLTLGDYQYEDGSPEKFQQSYDPSWGRVKAKTRPVIGNHEYRTPGAAGYWDYFGAAAGTRDQGWYSFDVGSWHLIALNTNCSQIGGTVAGGCGPGSPQEQFLRADLAAHQTQCTLAFFHHPRFSSGSTHGSSATLRPLWQALYDANADVVLGGHDHAYERFAPQSPDGVADPERGLAEFVVGTGGVNVRGFTDPPATNSQVRFSDFGVLKLALRAASYDWQFVSSSGAFTDTGTGTCH